MNESCRLDEKGDWWWDIYLPLLSRHAQDPHRTVTTPTNFPRLRLSRTKANLTQWHSCIAWRQGKTALTSLLTAISSRTLTELRRQLRNSSRTLTEVFFWPQLRSKLDGNFFWQLRIFNSSLLGSGTWPHTWVSSATRNRGTLSIKWLSCCWLDRVQCFLPWRGSA